MAVVLSIVALTAIPGVFAADPTQGPDAGPAKPTCSERYPDEGPAGVDLRLGCIVGEVMAAYTGARAGSAQPLSSYAVVVFGVLVAGFLAVWLVGRTLRRVAGRRLAPVQPGAWWQCTTCRSLNGAAVEHCYSCGAGRPDSPMLPTDDRPGTPQSFGSTRKRG